MNARGSESGNGGAERLFRAVADEAPVLIWISGPDGGCTFFNKPWLAFTGRALEQELGEGWTRGVHLDDLGACMATYTDSFRARRPFAMEYRLRRADGEYRWVLDHGRPRFEGAEFLGYIGTCIDVNDHRQLEAELRAREAELRVMNDALPVGLVLVNDRGGVMRMNPAAERFIGLSTAEASGEGWIRAVHPDDRERIVADWNRAWRAGATFESEHRLLHADGRVPWVKVLAAPVRDGGRLLGYVALVEDVTTAKEAAEAIREGMRRQLQMLARERALRRELDHRVRNNLASLLGLIGLYEGSGRDAGSVAEALRGKIEVMREVHELLGNDGAAGVELGELARRLAGLLAPAAHAPRLIFAGPRVALDSVQSAAVGMILHELFTNSRKHGALAGGAGCVEVRWRAAGAHGGAVPGQGFEIEWSEAPVENRVDRKGVGISLVEGFARGDLGGGAVFSFEPGRLRCTIRASQRGRSAAGESEP